MNGACEPAGEQLCGCCTGLTQETPEVITNRPALSSIAYRAGRYATFNASMLAALSDPSFPALAQLRTRDTTDFSIALLDAWAVALDILTFYQERFANEAFLRTAVDQRSVFELARLVGYEPSPGVAASAVLAFTLSSAPGSPDNVLIPAGTRVQSVPGPGQTPQVFETSADLTAVIGWNALPAQTTIPWQLAAVGHEHLDHRHGQQHQPRRCAAVRQRRKPASPWPPGPATFTTSPRSPVDPTSGNTRDLLGRAALVVISAGACDGRRVCALRVPQEGRALRRAGAQPANAFRSPTSDTCPAIPRPFHPGRGGTTSTPTAATRSISTPHIPAWPRRPAPPTARRSGSS